MHRPPISCLAPLAILLAGCVSQGRYDQLAATLSQSEARTFQSARALAEQTLARIADRTLAIRAIQERETRLTELAIRQQNLQVALDESTAIDQQLRDELKRLGKDVDRILRERGMLQNRLERAKVRLDELRRAEIAAEQRRVLAQELTTRVHPLLDGQQATVAQRDGLWVLTIASRELFDGGSSTLRRDGLPLLDILARALIASSERRFQIGVHVDPPVNRRASDRFAWALSFSRARAVVHQLVADGVDPTTLCAAGFGDHLPLVSNETDPGRETNRRIEITLLPASNDLLPIPAPSSTAAMETPRAER